MENNFTTVGKIGKPHGTSGAFNFSLHFEMASDELPPAFYVNSAKDILPYFPMEVNFKNDTSGFMFFEGIETKEQSAALANASLMIKETDFDKYFIREEEENFDGFEVEDKVLGNLGKVIETTDNTVQTVLSILVNGKEVMFPLVDAFVIKVDYTNQKLFLNLPEGLIEAYTQHNEERDED